MTEAELLTAVRGLARGLLLYHPTDSRKDAAGFPDLVIVGPGGVLWRELKSTDGRLRPQQTSWRYALLATGADWAVWRPADLDSGRITADLFHIR